MVDSMSEFNHLRWNIVGRTNGADYRIFHSEFIDAVHPRTGATKRFSALRCTDWVNVIAVTKQAQIVILRQYRPGTDEICIEIPGGMIDPGEAPQVAAARELEEETGYRADNWRALGVCAPNPAMQNNRLHTYLAIDAELRGTEAPDDGEVLEVSTVSWPQLRAHLRDGSIDHALVLAAFAHLAVQDPVLWASNH
jgi:ADP-ribose pyrophosphatase